MKKGGYFFMGKNQTINCTVHSCAFNNTDTQVCELDRIIVEPCKNCNNGNPAEESMCGSYEHVK